MSKSPGQIIREYFDFSQKDRNALITLIILILLVTGAHLVVNNMDIKSKADISAFVIAMKKLREESIIDTTQCKLFEFDPNTIAVKQLDSLSIPRFIKNNLIKYRSAGGQFYRPEDFLKLYGMNDSIYKRIREFIKINVKPQEPLKKVSVKPEQHLKNIYDKVSFTGTFDPNFAGKDTLEDLGFNYYQISNLLKYRENGGYFLIPSDLMKIYGIDSAFFNNIKQYIRINESYTDSSSYKVDDKETLIELNKTDSAELIKLRGIGPVFASRIIKYRELLGGFYSCRQILEVYNFPEETFWNIREFFYVDTLSIKKLRINFAGYNELIYHPYLNKKEVNKILDYRSKHGPFTTTDQFFGSSLTDSAKIEKIRPYISCR
jgi:DNA uptake protein ComE-like DNA-binding protein